MSAFVRDELRRRARKIAKRVRKLEALDPRRRHKLRIAVKKTRYACEFFDVPIVREVGKKRARKFDRSLKDYRAASASSTTWPFTPD